MEITLGLGGEMEKSVLCCMFIVPMLSFSGDDQRKPSCLGLENYYICVHNYCTPLIGCTVLFW